jgi:hypothetical protein
MEQPHVLGRMETLVMADKTIELNKEDSYIFIRYDAFGSAQFGIEMNATPTQLYAAIGFLEKHAELGLLEQISQVMQAKQRTAITKPENKIIVGK